MEATANPSPRDGTPLARMDAVVAGLLALSMAASAALLVLPGACGLGHDDGLYVVTAKALAEGEGYRLVHLPGAPAQTKYPPLLPMLLSLVWRAWPDFPANLPALLALPFLCGAAFVALAYLYLVRFGYASRPVAALASLAASTAPVFALQGAQVITEMPFAVLVVALLWRLETLAGASPGRAADVLLGVLGGLPALCRSLGVAFVPVTLWCAWRGGRSTATVAAGLALTVGPWFAWTRGAASSWRQDEVLGYYLDYVGWWRGSFFEDFALVLGSNFQNLSWGLGSVAHQGLSELSSLHAPLLAPLFVLAGFLAWWTIAVRWGLGGRPLGLALLPYLAIVLVWPWKPVRFLFPVLPMTTAAVYLGARSLVPSTARRAFLGVFAVLALVANGRSLARYADPRLLPEEPKLTTVGNMAAAWKVQEEAQEWVRRQTREDAVVASVLDPSVYLYTGRRSFRPFGARPMVSFYGKEGGVTGGEQELARLLSLLGATHLVVTRNPFFEKESSTIAVEASALASRHPGWLRLVDRLPSDPGSAIYTIHPEASDAPPPGAGSVDPAG